MISHLWSIVMSSGQTENDQKHQYTQINLSQILQWMSRVKNIKSQSNYCIFNWGCCRMSKQLSTVFERKTFKSIIDSSNQVKSQFKICKTIFRSRKFLTEWDRMRLVHLISFPHLPWMRVFPLQSAAGGFGPRRVTELRAELKKMFQSKKPTTNQNHHHYYPRKNTTIKPASQQHTRKPYQVKQLVCPGYGNHNTDLISHMALYEIQQNYSPKRSQVHWRAF